VVDCEDVEVGLCELVGDVFIFGVEFDDDDVCVVFVVYVLILLLFLVR